MKPVLFLSLMNSAAWGGSEELWHKSAIWLARKNYPVGVCCFNWPGKQDKLEQLQKAGCKIYLLPGKNETRSVFGKLKLKKAAKSVPFTEYETVVINQGGWMDAAYGLFKKLYKQLPDYILTYHNYNAREKLPAGKLKLLKEWIINASASPAR